MEEGGAGMAHLEVKLLGIPEVSLDGERLSFPLKKTEGLFYYLLLNERASREHISSMFWPDRDEGAAASNLRNSIYMIRKILTHDAVLSDKRLLSLNPEISRRLDLDELDEVSNPAFVEPQRYAQEFLAGFEILDSDGFTAWLRDMRLSIEERFLERLRERIGRCYEAEDRPELLRSLTLMVSRDASDEGFVLELMDLHVSEGRLPKALRVYKEFEKRLSDDLNILPSERARNYYAHLSAQSLGTASEARSRNIGDVFFARETELLTLISFLEEAQGARSRCVNIHGEPGVGKSMLARQLTLRQENTRLTFTAKAYDIGDKYFFSPWYDVVRELNARFDLGALDIDPIKLSLLLATFPGTFEHRLLTVNYEITSVFKDPSPVLLAHILAEIFQKLGEGAGALLVLEDIQWFDEMSMHLLVTLLATTDPSVSFVTTSRSKPGRRMRNMIESVNLRGETELLTLELMPFSIEEATGFLESVLDQQAFGSLDMQSIYERTYGLPLFLAEVASSIRTGDGQRRVQEKIHNVLAWRFDDLPPEEREVLELVSIFSSDASFEALASIIGIDRLTLSDRIGRLISMGTLLEDVDEEGKIRLRFRHACLRDFFYEGIVQVRRRELHRLLAEYLESIYDPEVWDPTLSTSLCHHLHCAAMSVKELDFMLREMRTQVMLNHELFPPLDDDQLKRTQGLLSGKAETISRLEQLKTLLFNLDRKRVDTREYLKLEATILELQGGYMIGWGQYPEGLQAIRRGLEIARSNAFERIHLNCLKHLCYYGIQTEDAAFLDTRGQEMLFVARECGDAVSQGTALRFIGVAHQLLGEFDEAETVLKDSSDLFAQLGYGGHLHTLGVLAARSYVGEIHHWRGDLDGALAIFRDCIDACLSAGLSWGLSLFYSKAGNAAFDMGDGELAWKYVCESIRLFEKGQGGRSGSIAYSLRATLDAETVHYARTLNALQSSENLCVPIHKRSWMAVHYVACCCVKRCLERDTAARSESDARARAALAAFLDDPSASYAQKAMVLAEELRMTPKLRFLSSLMNA